MIGNDVYVIAIDGLATRPLETLSRDMLQVASRAINRTADRGRTEGARAIARELAFPAGYLAPSAGRLAVTGYSTSDNLEATITARTRPTMLARFAKGGVVGKAGVTVEVAPGFAKFMKKAFLIRLPAGKGGDVDTQSNLGLAIRLKPGEVIHNKKVMQRLKGNLYLLYGPSISQAFTSVREDIAPGLSNELADEFTRLMQVGQS